MTQGTAQAADTRAPCPGMLPLPLRIPVFVLRLTALLVLVLLGLLVIVCGYAKLPLGARNAIGVAWSRILLRICGVRVNVYGATPIRSAALWVSNHVSWLDIYVLNSVHYTSFVAKRELRRWPVLGWLIAGAGTVFVDRTQRHAIREVAETMQTRFNRGEVVGLFPEGTTSAGYELLPFYAGLLEPALKCAVPVQPIALLFRHGEQRSDLASYTGDDTLVANLWRVLGTTGLEIEAIFLEPVETDTPGLTRHHLSATVHDQLAHLVNLSRPAER